MRGLRHGPLISFRSVRQARNPRAAPRVGLAEVLLDGRRAPAYASADLTSTGGFPAPRDSTSCFRCDARTSLVSEAVHRGGSHAPGSTRAIRAVGADPALKSVACVTIVVRPPPVVRPWRPEHHFGESRGAPIPVSPIRVRPKLPRRPGAPPRSHMPTSPRGQEANAARPGASHSSARPLRAARRRIPTLNREPAAIVNVARSLWASVRATPCSCVVSTDG